MESAHCQIYTKGDNHYVIVAGLLRDSYDSSYNGCIVGVVGLVVIDLVTMVVTIVIFCH